MNAERWFGVRRPSSGPRALSLTPDAQAVADLAAFWSVSTSEAAAILGRSLRADDPRKLDPLQRHLLCRATGLHDPRPDGTCRDCEAVIGDDPVCADDVTIHAQPDDPAGRTA